MIFKHKVASHKALSSRKTEGCRNMLPKSVVTSNLHSKLFLMISDSKSKYFRKSGIQMDHRIAQTAAVNQEYKG